MSSYSRPQPVVQHSHLHSAVSPPATNSDRSTYSAFPHRTSSLANSSSRSTDASSQSFSPIPYTPASPAATYSTPVSEKYDSNYEISQSWLDDESRPGSLYRESISSYQDSCQFDSDDWFAQYKGNIDISDQPPKADSILRAGWVPVYDSAGNSRLFKDLITPGRASGERQLVIFIRHFFCGACRCYVKALVEQIDMQAYFTMEVATSIIIVGCGSPQTIKQYKEATGCPFPVFADPTRQLFKHLGMHISLNLLGPRRPEYMKDVPAPKWIMEQTATQLKSKGMDKFRGGNMLQIGGEFLFQSGKVVWCHRMPNYRGHAEVDVIKRILGIHSDSRTQTSLGDYSLPPP